MNVVVFGSGSGTNLEALLHAQDDLFTIKALFTDRKCRFHEVGIREKIPVIYHSFVKFFKEIGVADYQDHDARMRYDREVAGKLQSLPFSIDLIVLAGYMRLITRPLLDAFPKKIINVHPADLSAVDKEEKRRYIGHDAVYLALKNGEKKTRSTVILVSEKMDAGPILHFGPWVPYTEGYPITKERTHRHHEKHKRLSDWPALTETVKRIAQGKISLT